MAGDDIAALAERAIAIAEKAASTQGKIADTQAKIVAKQHRINVIARWVMGFGVLDIVLTITIGVITGQQVSLTHAIHQSQLAACGIGNEFRVSQAQVWDHFIATSTAPPGETPAQRAVRLARLADARTYISGHFRPVDCVALYGK